MVGVAILMLLTAWTGVLLIRRTAPPKLFLKIMQYMTFSGWIATLAGWYVTEIGRQPWIVQGVLSVKDGSAPVARHLLISSLSMYLSIYLILLVSFVSTVFYMARKQKDDKFDLEYQASGKAMVNILTHK